MKEVEYEALKSAVYSKEFEETLLNYYTEVLNNNKEGFYNYLTDQRYDFYTDPDERIKIVFSLILSKVVKTAVIELTTDTINKYIKETIDTIINEE